MKHPLNYVLLVDDDPATNFINQMVIEEANITKNIKIVQNGREALDFITNKGDYEALGIIFPQPCLVLLDINMPVMDGWEFLQNYQTLPQNQKGKVIIVMLTTSLNPDDRTRAEKISDISGFRSKPLTQEIINGIVEKHFPGNF